MASSMVRVEDETYAALRARAEERKISMGAVIAELLEADRTRHFWEEANRDFLALRADPQAWAEEQALRGELAGTLLDDSGLDDAGGDE